MAAPFPYNARSGVANDPAEHDADALVAQYSWLARWSDEMHHDADLDHKKFAQFVFHCHRFRSFMERLRAHEISAGKDPVRDTLEGAFLRRKMRWASQDAMVQQLDQLYGAAGKFHEWAKKEMQHTRQVETLAFDENFETGRGQPVRSKKTEAVAERVRRFRELFE
jgi:hypothetical protein